MSADKDVRGAHSEGTAPARRAVSRRDLLRKVGWTAPVVAAVSIPIDAYASVSSGKKLNYDPNRGRP
ncbi:MAG: hypothetical protein ACUVTZ_10890 [Armatimonadota bacterium]